jgi:hypothetical protein
MNKPITTIEDLTRMINPGFNDVTKDLHDIDGELSRPSAEA